MSILKAKNASNPRVNNVKKTLSNSKTLVPLNVMMDSELHKKFKIKTINADITMTDFVLEAIKEYVK